MVDLVKIRKKSKDASEAAAEPPRQESPVAEPATLPERPEPPAVVAPAAPAQAAPVEMPGPVTAASTPKAASPKRAKQPPAPAEESPKDEVPAAAMPAAPAATPAVAGEPDGDAEDRLARFKRLAGKRRSWGAASKVTADAEETPAAAELELLRFRVAGEDYAVDIDKIVEIVTPRATTRVPNADPSIVGIMSLRGTIVTVVDLRRKLGHPEVDRSTLKDARMIVVERAGETAGFIVDRVSRVIKLERAQLESHPVVSSAEQSEFVAGVFQAQDGLVILLDIERILAG